MCDNENYRICNEAAETEECLPCERIILNCMKLKTFKGIILTLNDRIEAAPKKVVNVTKSLYILELY